MRSNLAKAIEGRWADYLRLLREGAEYSAVTRLGEISNCLRFQSLEQTAASKWARQLAHVALSPGNLQTILDEAARKVDRLIRICGGGADATLGYEEMLLLITMRIDLEMLLGYLAERRVDGLPDLSPLDLDLEATVSNQDNLKVFRAAQVSAKNNWGLPLRSRWLGTDVASQ